MWRTIAPFESDPDGDKFQITKHENPSPICYLLHIWRQDYPASDIDKTHRRYYNCALCPSRRLEGVGLGPNDEDYDWIGWMGSRP